MSPSEKRIILFLAFFLAVGAGARLYRERQSGMRFHVVRSPDNAYGKEASGNSRIEYPLHRGKSGPASLPAVISLNRATVRELVSIPGIGKALAREIVGYRESHGPYRDKHDLLRIDRITISLYRRIEPHLALR